MKEHPILFNGEMVRAILAGRKTQTRRVIKPQPVTSYSDWPDRYIYSDKEGTKEIRCPYGHPGDRLWVRESFCLIEYDHVTFMGGECEKIPKEKPEKIWSENDHEFDMTHSMLYAANGYDESCRYRPSTHMPRWASRITLEITDVRVERVQDISEEDAKAEGVEPTKQIETPGATVIVPPQLYRDGFSKVWRSINDKRGFGWDANPWVWVVGFKKVDSE